MIRIPRDLKYFSEHYVGAGRPLPLSSFTDYRAGLGARGLHCGK